MTQAQGQGSGFVIDSEGHILTNAHVVDGDGPVLVSFPNEDRVQAKIVGKDDSTDTALLKVTESADALRPLALGTSTSVDVGDPVVAIGNPFGLDRTTRPASCRPSPARSRRPTASRSTTRSRPTRHQPRQLRRPAAQHAGPGDRHQLADRRLRHRRNVGVGFAIPIDMVKQIATDLQKNGKVTHAWLGVALAPIDPALADEVQLAADKGAMVQTVQPGSPAAAAGLKPSTDQKVIGGETYAIGGDIIVAVDGKPVESITELQSAIQEHRAGDVVKLTVARSGGQKAELSVTLGAQPTSASAG